MKTGLSGMVKWLALAVFVLSAGCCYSCGLSGQPVGVSHAEELESETGLAGEPGSGRAAELGDGQAADPEAGSAAGSGTDVPGSHVQVSAEAPQESTEGSLPRTCFVHVCGEVERPGVYELTEGQRVYEAVELAGGFTDEASESFLNLAEPVQDGMKIQVPDQSMVQEGLTAGIQSGAIQNSSARNAEGIKGAANDGDGARARININTATKEELMTLRGIGEARAEDIISYRQQRGGFERIEDIMKVSGIKDAAFQKIKDDITV